MGDIGRIPLLFRTRHHMPPIFAHERRDKRLRGRRSDTSQQRSSAVAGPHWEFQSAEIAHRTDPLAHLHTSDIVSSMLLRYLQRHHQRFPQRALACYNGDRTLNIGKVFDEHVRLAACRTHSPNFGANTTPSTTARFQRLRTAARSHCFSCVAQDHQGTRIDNDSASSLYAFDNSFAVIAVCIHRLLV